MAPPLRAAGVHADGQVRHDAHAHPDTARARLRLAELLGDDPLAPLPELDAVGDLQALHLDGGSAGARQGLGQLDRLLPLHQGAPQGVVGQVRPAPLDEVVEVGLAAVGARRGEDDLERLALRLPNAVAVDEILVDGEVHGLRAQLLDGIAGLLGQCRVLGDGPGADVDGVEPAARNGQVRGVLLR